MTPPKDAVAGSGQSAGALGMADAFTIQYFAVLYTDLADPWKPDHDRVVTRAIVTGEEHQIHGGLGRAVAETCTKAHRALPHKSI